MPPAAPSTQLDLTPDQDRTVRSLGLVLFLVAGVLILAGAAWVGLGIYQLITAFTRGVTFSAVWIALLTLAEGGIGLLLGNILLTISNDFGYLVSARAYGTRHLANALTGLQHFAFGVLGLAAVVVIRLLSVAMLT